MYTANEPLVIQSKKNVNRTLHIKSLRLDKCKPLEEDGCNAYCTCGHKPEIVPIKKKENGKSVERFVAMCSTCMPGGAMELTAHKAPYLALQDFEDNCRTTFQGDNGDNRYAS